MLCDIEDILLYTNVLLIKPVISKHTARLKFFNTNKHNVPDFVTYPLTRLQDKEVIVDELVLPQVVYGTLRPLPEVDLNNLDCTEIKPLKKKGVITCKALTRLGAPSEYVRKLLGMNKYWWVR